MVIQWITCRQCRHRQGARLTDQPFEDEESRDERESVAPAPHRSSSDEAGAYERSSHQSLAADNSGAEVLGKIIGVLLVVVAIVWFVFNVAIPIVVINLALLAFVASAIRKDLSKFLRPLAVVGAVLVLTDYNQGWFTKTLATNVSFLAGLIPAFVYLNLCAGLVCAYLLIRDAMNARSPQGASNGEFTGRNMITMTGLVALGGLTVGLQERFGGPARHDVGVGGESRVTSAPAHPAGASEKALSVLQAVSYEPRLSQDGAVFLGTWVGYYVDSYQGQNRTTGVVTKRGDYISTTPAQQWLILRSDDKYIMQSASDTGEPAQVIPLLLRDGILIARGTQQDYYKGTIPEVRAFADGTLRFTNGVGTQLLVGAR
jgi:hypothetical protein